MAMIPQATRETDARVMFTALRQANVALLRCERAYARAKKSYEEKRLALEAARRLVKQLVSALQPDLPQYLDPLKEEL